MKLSTALRAVVDHYKALNAADTWFVAEERSSTGAVEVIGLGEGFIWSLLIERHGEVHATEAKVSEFTTGIEV